MTKKKLPGEAKSALTYLCRILWQRITELASSVVSATFVVLFVVELLSVFILPEFAAQPHNSNETDAIAANIFFIE